MVWWARALIFWFGGVEEALIVHPPFFSHSRPRDATARLFSVRSTVSKSSSSFSSKDSKWTSHSSLWSSVVKSDGIALFKSFVRKYEPHIERKIITAECETNTAASSLSSLVVELSMSNSKMLPSVPFLSRANAFLHLSDCLVLSEHCPRYICFLAGTSTCIDPNYQCHFLVQVCG